MVKVWQEFEEAVWAEAAGATIGINEDNAVMEPSAHEIDFFIKFGLKNNEDYSGQAE